MCSSALAVPILISSDTLTDSIPAIPNPASSTILLSSAISSGSHRSPACLPKSVVITFFTPGICLICLSVTLSYPGPYHLNVISITKILLLHNNIIILYHICIIICYVYTNMSVLTCQCILSLFCYVFQFILIFFPSASPY